MRVLVTGSQISLTHGNAPPVILHRPPPVMEGRGAKQEDRYFASSQQALDDFRKTTTDVKHYASV